MTRLADRLTSEDIVKKARANSPQEITWGSLRFFVGFIIGLGVGLYIADWFMHR